MKRLHDPQPGFVFVSNYQRQTYDAVDRCWRPTLTVEQMRAYVVKHYGLAPDDLLILANDRPGIRWQVFRRVEVKD